MAPPAGTPSPFPFPTIPALSFLFYDGSVTLVVVVPA